MSAALLKRSIAIVEESLPDKKKGANKFKESKFNQFKGTQKFKNNKNSNNKLSTLEKFKKISHENSIDKKQLIEENVQKLLKRDEKSRSFNMDPETTEKMFQRARTGRYVLNVPKKPVEEESLFTDEDFKNFEKEYFGT